MTGAFFRRNWFTIGILAMVGAAFLVPGGSALNSGARITNAITIALFLVIGLTLPSESILRDLRGVPLHLFVLGFIFVVNPLYFFLSTRIFARADDLELHRVHAVGRGQHGRGCPSRSWPASSRASACGCSSPSRSGRSRASRSVPGLRGARGSSGS